MYMCVYIYICLCTQYTHKQLIDTHQITYGICTPKLFVSIVHLYNKYCFELSAYIST